MSTTTDLQPYNANEHALTTVEAPMSSLPSIAEVRQKMEWMSAMRPVFREFIEKQMDPRRHMYTFDNNRYTKMTPEMLLAMTAEGKKPALNQDGIHNLMSLYECIIDEPALHELREEGFYTCRATIRLVSMRTGQPMGAGMGSCSTRESQYSYRWVSKNRLPEGVDPRTLKQRTQQGSNGPYTQYRLDNEDIADVEATVLQMAIKRAKSAAVKALPLVSEMFATVGDPDEDKHEGDTERQELLKPVGVLLRKLKTVERARAVLALFGEPLTAGDLQKLDVARATRAWQILEIASHANVDWTSMTVVQDVRAALAASAKKATTDLFGDGQDSAPQDSEVSAVLAPSHTSRIESDWREKLTYLVDSLKDIDLGRQAQSMCEDATVSDADGTAMLWRVMNALDAEESSQESLRI